MAQGAVLSQVQAGLASKCQTFCEWCEDLGSSARLYWHRFFLQGCSDAKGLGVQSLRAGERASSFPGLLTGIAGACLGPRVGSVSPPRKGTNLGRQMMYDLLLILSCKRKWKEEKVACRLCYVVSCQLNELHLGRRQVEDDFFFKLYLISVHEDSACESHNCSWVKSALGGTCAALVLW